MSHVFLVRGGVEAVVWKAGNGIADGASKALHGLAHESVGLGGGVHGDVDGGRINSHEAGRVMVVGVFPDWWFGEEAFPSGLLN